MASGRHERVERAAGVSAEEAATLAHNLRDEISLAMAVAARSSPPPLRCARRWSRALQICRRSRGAHLRCSPPRRRPGRRCSTRRSLGVGVAILLLLVTNRLFTEDLLNSQAAPTDRDGRRRRLPRRAEQPRHRAARRRAGGAGGRARRLGRPGGGAGRRRELAWAAAQARSRAARRCSWGTARAPSPRAACARRRRRRPGATVVAGPPRQARRRPRERAAQYLRALQILPGRIEFSYLPEETQALLILPTAAAPRAVIVGADRQRAFGEDAVQVRGDRDGDCRRRSNLVNYNAALLSTAECTSGFVAGRSCTACRRRGSCGPRCSSGRG